MCDKRTLQGTQLVSNAITALPPTHVTLLLCKRLIFFCMYTNKNLARTKRYTALITAFVTKMLHCLVHTNNNVCNSQAALFTHTNTACQQQQIHRSITANLQLLQQQICNIYNRNNTFNRRTLNFCQQQVNIVGFRKEILGGGIDYSYDLHSCRRPKLKRDFATQI